MTAAPIADLGPWTLDAWHRAEQPADGSRLHVVAGWPVVSPAPDGEHQWIGDELRAAFRAQLSGWPVTAVAVDVSTPHRTGVIPDVVVATRRPRGRLLADDVALVVEIWSPGNSSRERTEKRSAYASAGIPILWEVQRTAQGLELHVQRLAESAGYVLDDVVVLDDGPVTVETALGKIELDVQL